MSSSMNEIDIGVEDVTFEEVGGSKAEMKIWWWF